MEGRSNRVARRLVGRPRDAEIDQLHDPVAGDEHVGGGQVAVDDQVAVREGDRGADIAEQRCRSVRDGAWSATQSSNGSRRHIP
jgi:hypothetical protein